MSAKQVSISLPCPVCQEAMTIRELECSDCEITVRGNFGKVSAESVGVIMGSVAVPGAAAVPGGTANYGALTTEQAQFMETFLRCRGIIRDVEAALGISYPTVRARLDSLLATLGLSGESVSAPAPAAPAAAPIPPTPPAAPKASVKDILSRLDSGSLDAQSALDALRGDTPSAGKDAGSGSTGS